MTSRPARSKLRDTERSKRAGRASRNNVVVLEDGLKSDRIYRDLRRRIRELELQPGSQLDKNRIAEEYGVSRAPVSEAIARLAVEGLADVVPQSGSFVALIRLDDVRESLLIRTGLEVEIVRRATLVASDEFLERLDVNLELQAAAARGNELSVLDDLDSAFHGIILSAINSPAVGRLVDRARAILDRPRFYALPEEGRPLATVAEHQRIVDAIRTLDVELAGATMRVHLTMVAKAIERNIARMQAEAGAKLTKRVRN
jgi:DNA-binding GntR family transcriptional regulator